MILTLEKKSSKSALCTWQAMYNVENKLWSCFKDNNCCACDFCFTRCRLKRHSLFFGIVLLTVFVWSTRCFLKNSLLWSSPSFFILLTESTTVTSATTRVPRTRRSPLVSQKGLPIFFIVVIRDFTYLMKAAFVPKKDKQHSGKDHC